MKWVMGGGFARAHSTIRLESYTAVPSSSSSTGTVDLPVRRFAAWRPEVRLASASGRSASP